MIKRVSRILLLLGLLATLPVMAIDYHHSRTDGVQVFGTSVGQQSSNQAFNIFDSLLDAAASNFALYWMGEIQESGGTMTTPPFGNYPPTAPLQDNRVQDDDVDWATWQVVSTKTLGAAMLPPARPQFTPNVPQAWSPVELDLNEGTVGPDHFLIGVSFEPTTVAGSATNLREQILNVYYPQTAAGLPGNDPANITGPTGRAKGTVAPFWKRTNGLPGLRIRDLEPVRTQSANATSPGVGVVTQPPILARVPAVYKGDAGSTSETLPVVYLVVGTGENGDYAHVICLSLKRPQGSEDAALTNWLPALNVGNGSDILNPVEPPDPDNFNPNNGEGGAVMWSYRVQDASGNPMPVAGISFANVGTTADSQPLLFVTASKFDPMTGKPSDGKIICLNAKAADIQATKDDGDPKAGEVRWQYTNPSFTPTSTGVPEVPGFWYGMAPAVCRVPLTNVFRAQSGDESKDTIARAIKNHGVTEWEVFVADSVGIFRAFEASGEPQPSKDDVTSWDDLVRWEDSPVDIGGNPEYRMDRHPTVASRAPERFVVPPLVYQGNTPLNTENGALVAGSSDIGFDDEVIFASEKGTIYALDAVGRFTVNNSSATMDGTPTRTTDTRWTWPDDDTSFALAGTEEPRVWPRELGDPNSTSWAGRNLGAEVPLDDRYLCRSPLAVTLGANTNPNGSNPNLDDGDDVIFVPYMQSQGLSGSTPNRRRFYEYVGSLKPYGFVQASRPITQLTKVEAILPGNVTREIPLNHVRVGTVKTSGVSSTESENILAPSSLAGGTNPNYEPGITVEDTVYVVSPVWYDETLKAYVKLPATGAEIRLTYDAPTSTTNAAAQEVTETLPYPSCYRLEYDITNLAADPTILRSRASLSVNYNRLEQRRIRRAAGTPGVPGVATVTDELPAEVEETLVDTYHWRPAAMMASGSGSTNGTLMVPTWFRGRIVAFSNRLLTQRVILGCYDPRIDPAVRMAFSVTDAATPYGPVGREFRYDPGVFYDNFLDDEPLVTDVGGSVVLVDGWAYVMYRNGHLRAFSNVGGGAAGTQYYPPIFYVPSSPNNGNLVRAPAHDATDQNRGIHISKNPAVANSEIEATNTANYLDLNGTLDQSVMLEMGQTIYIIVDYGPSSELAEPQTIDPNAPRAIGNAEIDQQVLQYEVQAQLRSSNGAVQQLPGLARGVRPTVQNNRIVAVIPVFTGVPSPTNPLTPGTPLLWERQPADFTGEVTFDIQVTQQGVQWRWPGGEAQDGGGNWIPLPDKQHFWEAERNTGATRFPTTGGTTDGATAAEPPANAKWSWASEWAPLFTYNNPIMVGYDPDGVNGAGYYGIASPTGSVDLLGNVVDYTSRNQPGRKNGDVYIRPSVNGARSGSGQPVVPFVGMVHTGSGANAPAKQLLYADHGTSTPPSMTGFPEAGKIRVGDRSYLATIGRNLTLRVQPAPLTKMGVGALFGITASSDATLANFPNAPKGSFEQNVNSWDDGPDGAYSSIPEARINVTKDGTNLNLVTSPIQVPGRNDNFQLPTFGALEALAVQVDIPRYTADDIYSTRWRTAGQFGANPLPISSGGSVFNPFFTNGSYAGIPTRLIRDRAEKFAKGPTTSAQGPNPAPNEDPGMAPNSDEPAAGNQNYDDRLRRMVIYNDANNNGQLDLLPTYREAYRTFGVQVVVKPQLKLDVSQQVLDLGAMWHGKKQPGLTGGGSREIQEWQRMNLMAASGVGADASVAAFYRQYWRQFNIYNTGNVNLSVVKPEVAYQSTTSGLQLVGFPSEGNDPWRALSLLAGLSPVNGGPNPLTDPYQIFLRTSFDDQLLPDNNAYGSGGRAVWLQKAPAGSSQPGAVAYAEKVASASTLGRDPTNRAGGTLTAEPRETWLTLNIPTGAALGQYSGSLRFYNDRTVAFKEDFANSPVGYLYQRPTGLPAASVGNGVLERDASGEPLEPASDSPLRIKAKITENLVHGRYITADGAKDIQDRRMQPAAVGYTSAGAQGTVQNIVLAYAGNRLGLGGGQPALYDLFGTQLKFDTGRFLFPFDELPLDRAPWADLAGGGYGWTNFTAGTTGFKISRPSAVQDMNGVGVLAWTEQQNLGAGTDLFRIFYQGLSATPAPTLLQPGGQPPDPRLQRSGVRMLSAPVGATNNWLAIYAAGTGARRNLMYTATAADPTQAASSTMWSAENVLATSSALTSVNDPSVFATDLWSRPAAVSTTITADASSVPAMTWVGYTGSNSRIGHSDVYVSRFRTAALTTAGQRGVANQQGKDQDYALASFPRTEGDILKPDVTRTTYISGGLDFLFPPTTALATIPTVGPSPIQLYLGRPDVPFGGAAIGATGRNGSLAQPIPLIGVGQPTLGETPQGEMVFALNPDLVAASSGAAQQQLQTVKIFIDRSAGAFRLSMDARRLAALTLTSTAMTPASPDPVLSADYTASTMRITRSGVSSSDAVVVPVMSRPGQPPVMDASWYKQQITPNAWATGTPVPGRADRLWVIWRRAAGAVAGGPTTFYKVLRPGIRVRAGQISSITPATLTFSPSVVPEEVNPSDGTIFFPAEYEGQRITVTYGAPGGFSYSESHVVGWQDETGERPLPMENSVNEGTLDAFVSYEDATMQGGSVRKMERMWVFWSSTRNSGGDLYYATLAPRIGPDVNVQGSINYSANSAASAAALSRLSPSSARATLQQFAVYERQHPFVVPRVTRRGPYVPTRATGARPARR